LKSPFLPQSCLALRQVGVNRGGAAVERQDASDDLTSKNRAVDRKLFAIIFGAPRGLYRRDVQYQSGQERGMQDDDGLPKLPAPAARALAVTGYTRLDQLALVAESELERLHGMGPSAIAALPIVLERRGMSLGT
jgi:hypothetical protein